MLQSKYRFRKVTRYLMSLPSASDPVVASRVGSETPTSSIMSTSEGCGVHEPKSAPVFLPVGAAVSAKYRGAFCEASIERVTLNYRIRVQLKDRKVCVTLDKSNVLSGNIEPNSEVSVLIKSGDFASTSPQTASIIRITDLSLYTVVFDDGDKRSLKRTQLVLKGERHFKESESLDRLPLTNPEQFKQPVIDRSRRYQSSLEDDDDADEEGTRPQRPDTLDAVVGEEGDEDREEDEGEEEEESTTLAEINSLADEEAVAVAAGRKTKKMAGDGDRQKLSTKATITAPAVNASIDEDNAAATTTPPAVSIGGHDENDSYRHLLGSLVMIDMPIVSKNDSSLLSTSTGDASALATAPRRRYAPGLVTLPSAMPSIDLKAVSSASKDTVFLVKSFRENRFYAVPRSYLEPLSRAEAVKLAHQNPSLRTAFERAILWLDRRELPASWGSDLDTLLGPNWRPGPIDEDNAEPSKLRHFSSSAVAKKSRRRRRHRSLSSSSADASSYSASDSSSVSIGASSSEGEDASPPPKRKPRPPKPIKRRQQHPRKMSSISRSSAASSSGSADDKADSNEEPDDDGGRDSDASTSSDSPEYFEERDRWIAKLYRFMDARGTPINKAPSIANKDLDLFKLYRKVDRLGGFHRVTSQLKWAAVYSEMDLPHSFTAGPRSLQTAFKKYLFPINDLSRKLGTSLDEIPIPLPRKSKATASLTTTLATAGDSSSTGQKSGSKTAPGSVQTVKALSKADEAKKEAGQRRASGPKDEKLLKIPDPKSRPSTSSTPGASTSRPPSSYVASKRTPPSTDTAPLQGKEKKIPQTTPSTLSSVTDFATPKSRIVQKSATPEPSFPPPPPLPPPSASSKKSSASRQRLAGVGSGGFFEEPHSASSSPVLPTFENEPLNGSDPTCPHSPIPVGTMVRVRHKGHSYKAKIVQHVYDSIRPASIAAREEKDSATALQGQLRYRIHYAGWNARHDEVINRERIISLISYVRRSPSCSTLDLIDPASSAFSEDVETVSDGGGRQQGQRRLQKHRARQTQHPQQRGRQSVKRPYSSSTACDSDSAAASICVKKVHRAATPDEVKSALSKRNLSGLAVDTQQAKKRRLQTESKFVESKLSKSESEQARGVGQVLGKSIAKMTATTTSATPATTSSIVDAATSLAQSPNLLKKVMCREPVDLKSSPSPTAVTTARVVTTPAKSSSSKLGLEDISSDEDGFPPQQNSTPVRRPANVPFNISESQQSLSPKSLSPPSLSPPVKRIKQEPNYSKVAKTASASAPSLPPKSAKASTFASSSGRESSVKVIYRRSTATKKLASLKPEEGEDGDEQEERQQVKGDEKAVKFLHLPKTSPTPPFPPSPTLPTSYRSSEAVDHPSPKPKSPAVIASSSSEDEEDRGKDNIMATSDVLPRLTRSQHRLILGDTPPGAQLLTATANPPVTVKKEEEPTEAVEVKESGREGVAAFMKKPEKEKKVSASVGKKTGVLSEKIAPKKVQKAAVPLSPTPKASASSSPLPESSTPKLSTHPPSPIGSVISDSTEPMRLSPPSDMLLSECKVTASGPAQMPSSSTAFEASGSSSSTPARSSSAEVSAMEEEEGEAEEEGEDGDEEEGEDTGLSKSPLPPPRPSSGRGRSPRGGFVRGSGGRRRKRNASSTVNASALNDDAESVVSSASSGLRNGRRGLRGRRGSANATTATAARCSSFLLSSPVSGGLNITGGMGSLANTSAPPTPTVRRFGGPYHPIPNLESLSSGTRCLILQHRLMQIIEAWRSAKQMLKAVDQRAAAVTAALSSSANTSSGGPSIGGVNSGASGGGRGGGGIGGANRRGGGGFRGGPRRRPPSVNLVEEPPASSVTE
ncbi:AT-rich interactive domain-containing protein 4A [Taenia crassiceps]|uniref:AT-rich interactive domain-containing protein 4A n=1 Tax=Taenia crassiceps TaxID=6207 RepID=A0ABR4QES6_9CEST